MSASYPTAVKTFTTKNTNDVIQPAHINDPQDEIAALETELLTTSGTAYTPTFSSSGGVAASLGNGTITGTYRKTGKRVDFHITLGFGSTSNAGSGNFFLFGLPSTAVNTTMGAIVSRILDSGTQFYIGVGYLNSTTTVAIVITGTTGSGIGAGTPMTWANGDTVNIDGWYIEA